VLISGRSKTVMAAVDIDDESVYRLEGSNSEQKGGLIIKKKVKKELEDDDFKVPQLPAGGSLLGLDKLAGKIDLFLSGAFYGSNNFKISPFSPEKEAAGGR